MGLASYHELLLDPAEALDARRQLEVVVCRGFGNGGNDGDPIPLGADVVSGGDAGDVDVCLFGGVSGVFSQCRDNKNIPFLRPTCDCGMIIWHESLSLVLASGCLRMQMARRTWPTTRTLLGK